MRVLMAEKDAGLGGAIQSWLKRIGSGAGWKLDSDNAKGDPRRKEMIPLSIRSRLAIMFVIVFLGGMAMQYVAANEYARIAADRSFDRVLAGSTLSIAETLAFDDGGIQVDIPYPALDMLSTAPDDRVFYGVIDGRDNTITGYSDLPEPTPTLSSKTRELGEVQFFTATYRGEPVRFATLERQFSVLGTQGSVRVQVGQTRLARTIFQRELVLRAVAPIAMMTLFALGVAWFAIASALRPLVQMGSEVATRDPANLHPLNDRVPKELQPLVEAMNGFMARLALNIETLRAFMAEAAHQMRTPLAVLRAQAQVGAAGDDEEARASLAAVDRNAAKLARLLDQLLSDAVVSHRTDATTHDAFDLIDIFHDAIHESTTLVKSLSIDEKIEAAPFHGDRILIREAIKNLIDNAVRHGGGELLLSIDRINHGYEICVSDRGPGLAGLDPHELFQRFARGVTGSRGTGLGLAIAKRALAHHGGDVWLEDRLGGGLMARLYVPQVQS